MLLEPQPWERHTPLGSAQTHVSAVLGTGCQQETYGYRIPQKSKHRLLWGTTSLGSPMPGVCFNGLRCLSISKGTMFQHPLEGETRFPKVVPSLDLQC